MSKNRNIVEAVELAVGLGGWKTDTSDPFKQPYSPRNAALAAAERFEITDPEVIDVIEAVVEARREIEEARA